MVQIGSVGGALIAFIACDKLGTSATLENITDGLEKANLLPQVVCGLLASSA